MIVDAHFIAPGSIQPQRAFVLKVLRALKEVGAFYVNGHSLSSDLFQLCQAAYGNQPFQDDALTGSDSSYKTNHRLYDTRETYSQESLHLH